MRPKIFFLIWFIFLPLFLILIFDLFFGKYFFPNINETENIYIRHSIYHHTIKPNFNSELRWGKNLYTACSNNLGFKSKCNIKANKNFDLAFIGDSFTEGIGYPYEKTFVGIIEKESKQSNCAINCANCSAFCRTAAPCSPQPHKKLPTFPAFAGIQFLIGETVIIET